ncbi:MAG: hypothetical protein R3348_04580 [Xanthomonadales bacterium]|nr:hypothetical protein [Xanthomonadales bacterium]
MKHFTWVIALCCLLSCPPRAHAEHPVSFENVNWQDGAVADMAMFEPYIGTFRGQTYEADGGVEYFFSVTYEWYDRPKSVVKYTLRTHITGRDEVRPLGEGFYLWDAFNERIAVVGVFLDGRKGTGFMSPYDTESGEREVRIRSMGPNGSPVQVRDTFWLIDDDTWGNATFISTDGKPWQKVSEDTYRRFEF